MIYTGDCPKSGRQNAWNEPSRAPRSVSSGDLPPVDPIGILTGWCFIRFCLHHYYQWGILLSYALVYMNITCMGIDV